MANVAELLAEEPEVAPRRRVADLLADEAPVSDTAEAPVTTAAPGRDLPWYQRAASGIADPIVGAGQLMQNVLPDGVLNAARRATGTAVGLVPGLEEIGEDIGRPRSSEDFNQIVKGREDEIQTRRAEAGQEGLDWWRVGGNVANPLTWLGGGTGKGVWEGLKAGAKVGLFQSLLQPVVSEGNFWVDKGTQAAIGTGTGGILGAAMLPLTKGLTAATQAVRKGLKLTDDAAIGSASQKTLDDVLQAAEIDPKQVDPNLYSAMRQEVTHALKAGAAPDPKVIERTARAASLPVPIQMTRAQATGDPMLFAWEHRVSGQQGVGEPLAERLSQQNRALIENLNVLGADKAPSQFDAGQKLIERIQSVDKQMKGAVDQAYGAVRDNEGRSALMSADAFRTQSKEALEQGMLTENVPDSVRAQYNAIIGNTVPLTVERAQVLDSLWSAEQRSAQGSAKAAIGVLRDALNNAPIDDQLGAEAMQAYQQARGLARRRFEIIEKNPAIEAVVNGTKQAEPDKFFRTFVQGGNVGDLANLKQILGPEASATMQGAMIGELKRAALSGASEERGTFSKAAFNKLLRDPTQGPRIREIFRDAPDVMGRLNDIGTVSEDLSRAPAASRVNYSNTASASANIVRDVVRSEAGSALASLLPRAVGVGKLLKEAGERARLEADVAASLSPGVTSGPVKAPATPVPLRSLSDLLTRAGAASVARGSMEDREND